jgi:hypothetical protein
LSAVRAATLAARRKDAGIRCRSGMFVRLGEALRGAAEAAEHAGVELGRDQDEDVVAEEGQRHGAQQRQREQPGPPMAPPRLSPHCAGSGQGARRGSSARGAALAALEDARHAWWRRGAPAMACERSHAIT